MSKLKIIMLSLMAVVLLQACGGDEDEPERTPGLITATGSTTFNVSGLKGEIQIPVTVENADVTPDVDDFTVIDFKKTTNQDLAYGEPETSEEFHIARVEYIEGNRYNLVFAFNYEDPNMISVSIKAVYGYKGTSTSIPVTFSCSI